MFRYSLGGKENRGFPEMHVDDVFLSHSILHNECTHLPLRSISLHVFEFMTVIVADAA